MGSANRSRGELFGSTNIKTPSARGLLDVTAATPGPICDLRRPPQMSARLVLRRTSTSVRRPCRLAKGELSMNVARAKQCLLNSATVAALLLLLPQVAMAKKEKRDKKSGSPETASACVEKYK